MFNALENFDLGGEPTECIAHGNGHINDTFLVLVNQKNATKKYILQTVNGNVFKEPEKVMENIEKVTEFLKLRTDNERSVMSLVPAKDGKKYYIDEHGHCWRVYDFIEDSICLDRPEDLNDFYQCAYAFGKFQRFLDDFPADTLHETISDFHNTPKRFKDFLAAVEADMYDRVKNVREEIKFIIEREKFYSVLTDAHKEGRLPLRVTHNDTKSNNVMLDKNTHDALCVIDLDTIMPGFSVTDFGDAIRFGASTADEDEKDLSKVSIDLNMFDIYTKGFLDGNGGLLKNDEILLLPEGAKMMTVECGMRFLTDYLCGDTYFKTAYPEHNLVRCRTQLKLVEDMEKHWEEMKKIVSSYLK